MINKECVLSKIIDTEVTDEPWNHIVIKDYNFNKVDDINVGSVSKPMRMVLYKRK